MKKYDQCKRYSTRESLSGGKLMNLADLKLFTELFLANTHRYTKNVFGIYTLTVTYLAKFSLPIDFTCMFDQNFPSTNVSHIW